MLFCFFFLFHDNVAFPPFSFDFFGVFFFWTQMSSGLLGRRRVLRFAFCL